MTTYCNISLSLMGKILEANIVPEGGRERDDVFFVYLLRNGTVLQKSNSWSKDTKYSFELQESGLFAIQAHVKRNGINTITFTVPVLYLSSDDEKKFSEFINSPEDPIPELHSDVFHPSYPHTDFLFIGGQHADAELSGCAELAAQHGMVLRSVGGGWLMAQEDAIGAQPEDLRVLSGSAFLKGKLIFGHDDIGSLSEVEGTEPTGNYSYLSWRADRNSITVGTDFFGIAKVYYLQYGSRFIVGNNYHLLLLAARSLGLPLELDTEKVKASLTFANIQFFHQTFSRKMDVAPVQILPADKAIEIRDGTLRLKDTGLTNVLGAAQPFDERQYRKLVNQAADEILANTRAVLEHPSFDHVLVDLSGGLDSRLVFCALTHFPEHARKVRLNSLYSNAEPDDLVVAQEVASLYDFDYNDLPRIKALMPGKHVAAAFWSYNLGVYYSYKPSPWTSCIRNAARMNGFYGEICARPYFSRRLQGTELDVENPETFVGLYLARHRASTISSDKSCLDALHRLFVEELEQLPGRSALEKLENHYMFYRNGLHCSDRLRSLMVCPEFGPIQSKSLIAAKLMGYHKFKSAKTQFDVIATLNPVVAGLRYESPYDNEDLERIAVSFGILSPEWTEKLHIVPGDNAEKWKAANSRIRTHLAEDSARSADIVAHAKNFEHVCFDLTGPILKALGRAGVLEGELLKCMWLTLCSTSAAAFPNAQRWNILNRVVSLYMQHRLISMECA